MSQEEWAYSPRSLISPGHRATEVEAVAEEVSLRDEHKPAPVQLPAIRNSHRHSTEQARANLKALNMEMLAIDEVQQNAPRAESNVLAGGGPAAPVPVEQDAKEPEKATVNPRTSPPPATASPLRQSLTSPVAPEQLDEDALQDILHLGSDFDLTVEGRLGGECRRNKAASLVVGAMLLISVELIWEHVMMISWVVSLNSWQMVVAVLCYAMSALFNTGMLAVVLISPSCSVGPDLHLLYGLFLVSGLMSVVAVALGGSAFGVVVVYSLDYEWIQAMTGLSIICSTAISGALYYLFTRPNGTAIAHYFHPFEARPGVSARKYRDLSSSDVKTPV